MRCRVGVGGHGFSNISGYQTQIPPQLGFVSGFAFSSLLAISDLIIAPFFCHFSFLFSASDVQIPRLVCHHVVSWRFLVSFSPSFSYPERVTQNSSRVTLDGLHIA
ncbi:uncharacterized protein AKAW2_41159A [Aspergillus luchuensis]|uniref:Uncharacterized protein n=1 Tax=Aspergillus kawachii TaxID=1069201 RepID=A0A7R7WAN2_ASPKA|nr:uncharacterized protein AKAW2_41159A [Aspergillus luchuensis]BCR99476.1 hypothetical protein AKAW2_41159A [Aspergillus luchuensis]BCS11776.1 hypothetical protein ALUC_41116A [Aspergillus luchuensis]